MLFISNNLKDTENLGCVLGENAKPGDVYCLLGELGAGKTALAQAIGKGLGVKEAIVSPTFTLIHEYQGRIPLYHMDLYRMSSPEEGEDIGLQEYFWGKGVCVVEWPMVAAELLPEDILQIDITVKEGVRLIELTGHGLRSKQLAEEVKQLVDIKY